MITNKRKALAKSVGAGLLAGALSAVVLGFLSDLIPNPFFTRMTSIAALDYLFLATTVVLVAVYYGLYVYMRSVAEGEMACSIAGGGVLGFLAFGCPTCNKLLVALLGTGTVLSVFDPLRPVIGALSIVLMLAAIGRLIFVLRLQGRLAASEAPA